MKRYIVITTLVGSFLAGCKEKQQFSCESDAVTGKVIELQANAFNSFLSRPGMKQALFNMATYMLGDNFTMDNDNQDVKFKLDAIRTVNQNKDLGNYECKALLYSEKGTEQSEGVEITYTSESTNNGKDTYVQTHIVNDTQMGNLASVLLKVKEFPEKTTRGTIDYGSLDSSVGDFSFATQSDVGKVIFAECDVESECEVKAKVEETEFGDIIKNVIKVRKLN